MNRVRERKEFKTYIHLLFCVLKRTLDPVVYGDYPPEMRRIHGNELPRFTSEESMMLSKSIDFIGINHYGSLYAKDCIHSSCICNENSCSPGSDRAVRGYVYTTGERDGVPIGQLVSHNSPCLIHTQNLMLLISNNFSTVSIADWNGSIFRGPKRHGIYSGLCQGEIQQHANVCH